MCPWTQIRVRATITSERSGVGTTTAVTKTRFDVSSAIVWSSGEVEELEGRAARHVLEEERLLARYAVAFLEAACADVRFFWRTEQGGWVRVRLKRTRTTKGEGCAVQLSRQSPPFELTARELDVLTLLTTGFTNREIGASLRTSARTVSTHVERILRKLGARTRSGAAAVAADRGLLRLPVPAGVAGVKGSTVGDLEASMRRAAEERMPPVKFPVRHRRPYLIGSAIPLTGPARADGMEMRNGASLAIEEINSRSGVAGRPIEHLLVDTDIFTEEGVQAAIRQLIEADVDAITMGYAFSGADLVLELVAECGAVYLHATTSELQWERVRTDPIRFERIFQACPTEVHYGRGFVRFLDDLVASGGWSPERRSLMIVETPIESGQMATPSTVEAIERSGWSMDAVERVPELGADWASLVHRIHAVDPAAILIADFVPSELAAFQLAFVSQPSDALVYALYAPSVPEFLQLAGPAAEGLVWSTMTGTCFDALGSRFADRYNRVFRRSPGRSHAGVAYDMVHLLANAWAHVGHARDFDGVAKQLRQGTFRGVNGVYHFDDSQATLAYPDATLDQSLGQAHLVFQIQEGQHRTLSPAPYVERPFCPPPWWGASVPA